MKKLLVVIALLSALALLSGCGGSAVPDSGALNNAGASQDAATSDKIESTTTKAPTKVPVDEFISESKAKSIAFDKAGVKEKDASRLEVDLDYDSDQKRWEYEVDFYVDRVEYEVDIDAKSGTVLLFKKDDNTVSKSTTSSKATTATTTTSSGSKLISKEQAKELALEKAGVKVSEISRYRIKTDYDDDRNRWEYEIDFYVGKVEYDVTVDAVKGIILEYEREDEDDKRQATATTKPKLVSKEDAKAVALFCAGVDESKVSEYEIELDYDDDSGRWEYEVNFRVGRIEYDVLINAVDGELIRWDKEIDD